jgi:hypothetical protein
VADDRNESYEEEVYIIPHNYRDNGKILGLIEKRSFIQGLAFMGPSGFLLFYILPLAIKVKIYIFILLILPPTAIIMVGIGHDSLEDFLKYVYYYYQRAKVYHYDK